MKHLVLAFALWLVVPGIADAKPVSLGSGIGLFDANLRYTSGTFFPLAAYDGPHIQPLTTPAWGATARAVNRVAADGVSLILVRILLPRSTVGPVTVDLTSDEPDTDPGGLWSVDDGRVLDTSPSGGAIDDRSVAESQQLTVPTFVVSRQRFAFVLYRAPRNFDAVVRPTAQLDRRTVRITAHNASSTLAATITVVRPAQRPVGPRVLADERCQHLAKLSDHADHPRSAHRHD
ncbi:MAG: hypothetical protein ACRDHK_12885 [Actinomycetota bacterium]